MESIRCIIGISQAEMCKLLGGTGGSYYNWITKGFKLRHIEQMCDLGINMSYFREPGKEPMFSDGIDIKTFLSNVKEVIK